MLELYSLPCNYTPLLSPERSDHRKEIDSTSSILNITNSRYSTRTNIFLKSGFKLQQIICAVTKLISEYLCIINFGVDVSWFCFWENCVKGEKNKTAFTAKDPFTRQICITSALYNPFQKVWGLLLPCISQNTYVVKSKALQIMNCMRERETQHTK